MMRDWRGVRRRSGRFRQKQFQTFDLQAHFLPCRIFEDLEKRFDEVRALNQVSFDVEAFMSALCGGARCDEHDDLSFEEHDGQVICEECL